MIGHAVFDLDGTLIDSVPLFAEILNAMLADRGSPFRLSEAEVRPHATAGGLAMVKSLLGEACGEPSAAIAEFRQRYADIPTPASCLYPGVREGLTALEHSGAILALFSNKTQLLCDKVLRELELSHLFSAVVGTSPGVPLKPDPAGLDLALARAGGVRQRSCYVGDSGADHALALAAGVPLIMVSGGYGQAGRDWPGAAIAHDFASVPSLVMAALSARVAA